MTAAEAQPVRARSAVAGERRVFSLVLALVASPQGLTKQELLSTVHGYAERYTHGETDVALERQFERDKEQLRELGIPLETIDSPFAPGDNRLTRYRISKQRLQVPETMRFTAREIAVLRLAALSWAEGSLTAESRRSAMKIEALGAGLEVQHFGLAPRLGIADAVAPKLKQAIDEGRIVRFDYRLADRAEPLARRVAPLKLHRAEGRWHLLAFDLERDADRVFLLSRIVGSAHIEREEFDRGLESRIDGMIDGLDRLRRSQRVAVGTQAGSIAESRLVARGTVLENGSRETVLEFGTLDLHELAPELAGFGEQVVVRAPDSLRDEVVRILLAVQEQHGDSAVLSGEGRSDAA